MNVGVTTVADTGTQELRELSSTDLSKFLDEDLESNSNTNAFPDLDSILDGLHVTDNHLLLTNPEKLLSHNYSHQHHLNLLHQNDVMTNNDGLHLVAMSPTGGSDGLLNSLSPSPPNSLTSSHHHLHHHHSQLLPSLLQPVSEHSPAQSSSSNSSLNSPGNSAGLISSTIDFGCDLHSGTSGQLFGGSISNQSNSSSTSTRTSPVSPFDEVVTNGITVVSSVGESSSDISCIGSGGDCVPQPPSTTTTTIIHHHHHHHLSLSLSNPSTQPQQSKQPQQQQHLSILSVNSNNSNNNNNDNNNSSSSTNNSSSSNNSKSLLRPPPQLILHRHHSPTSNNGRHFVSLRNSGSSGGSSGCGDPNSPTIVLQTNTNLSHSQQIRRQPNLDIVSNPQQSSSVVPNVKSNNNSTNKTSVAQQLHQLRSQTVTPTPQPDSTTPTPNQSSQSKCQSGSILENALRQQSISTNNHQKHQLSSQPQQKQHQRQHHHHHQGSESQTIITTQQTLLNQRIIQQTNTTVQHSQQKQQHHHRSLFNNKNDISMSGMLFLVFLIFTFITTSFDYNS